MPEPAVTPATPSLQIVASRFVTVDLASHMTGLSKAAIRTKIAKAVWLEGREYVRREGNVLVDMRGYERWAEGARE